MNAVGTSPPTPVRGGDRLPMAGLLALAATGFLTMVTETVPAGLLSPTGTSLHTPAGRTGQLLTAYAIGSMIAAIPLTALTPTVSRGVHCCWAHCSSSRPSTQLLRSPAPLG